MSGCRPVFPPLQHCMGQTNVYGCGCKQRGTSSGTHELRSCCYERKKERKTPKRGFQGVGVVCTPHHMKARGVTADRQVEQDGEDEQRNYERRLRDSFDLT